MNLTLVGVHGRALEARVHSACAAFGITVASVSDQPSLSSLFGEDLDWDILFLGSSYDSDELPEFVRASIDHHPSGYVIAMVEDGASEEHRRSLLRSGALEVLSADPSSEDIELAIGRASTLIHRCERQVTSEKFGLISQLAVGVNHEINNPLTGLMGTAELLLMENEDLPEKIREDLRTIIEQARRIQRVTLRLRHLDRLRTVPYDENDDMLDLIGATDDDDDEVIAGQARRRSRPRGADDQLIFESPRLLVVDDNPLIIDLMHRTLRDRFEVDHALGASEAINLIQAKRYDLIILDLVMPEMDGLELFRAVRRIRPDQRVVMATGYDGDERIEKALAEGALDWIRKPFKFNQLEEMLWEALKSSDFAHSGYNS